MDASTLVEIEQIRQLKARYFRLMDTRQWEDWGQVFTEDCTAQYPDLPLLTGRDSVVSFIRGVLDGGTSIHFGHMPEIQLDSDRHATGIWSMVDYLDCPGEFKLRGYGHYWDEYIKGPDDVWRISATEVSRMRVDPL